MNSKSNLSSYFDVSFISKTGKIQFSDKLVPF